MKLGYIHNDRAEQVRVQQILKMTAESVAIDELGIGRIRDAFANLMFPGTSTLQKHLKYFSLMPQVYRQATKRHYNRLSEVKTEIVRLERTMTKNLYDGSTDKRGITGSETIDKNTEDYVKYDPAFIYNTGLQTFGILRYGQLLEHIYSASKQQHEAPKTFKSEDEDTDNDADDKGGLPQFCSFPNVNYEFLKQCSIDLTQEDKVFITDHILKATDCRGTLLRYIVENEDFPIANTFEEIPTDILPKELGKIQDLARRFADFMQMVHTRYNYIWSKYDDEELRDKFEEQRTKFLNSGTDMDKVLNAIKVSENSGKIFCQKAAERIMNNKIEGDDGLDQLIRNREKRVKGKRRKLDNDAYPYDKKKRIHPNKLNYRWDTVKVFAQELRKEAQNG